MAPSLSNCSPSYSSSSMNIHPLLTTCECASDFTDPPSLHATIRYFAEVSDCALLRSKITLFHWVLFGLYGVGALLSVVIGGLAGKRLHFLGVCGNSGVYSVTPEPTTPTDPSPAVFPVSHPCVSHTSNGVGHLPVGTTVNQR